MPSPRTGTFMRLPHFERVDARSIEEACAILAARGAQAIALAGGTDLLVKMKQRKVVPRCVVSLKGIRDLDYIRYDDTHGLQIGALATIQALKNSNTVKRRCSVLAQAAAAEASVQIRNIATIGGNIANASPAADAPLALLAAQASVIVAGLDGERTIPLEKFFTAPGRTGLRLGELVKEVRVPPARPRTGAAYIKHALRRTDIAIVSTAVTLTVFDGVCASVRIGLGSVAPTPLRARKAEGILTGQEITDQLIEEAAEVAAKEASPISDIRGGAEYRLDMIRVLCRRAARAALARAQGKQVEV